jgi:hypothetical protein
MSHGENLDAPATRPDSVQGDVTGVTKRDHQFPNHADHQPANRGMAFEDRQGVEDRIQRFARRSRALVAQKLRYSFEIGKCTLTDNYAGH